MNEAELLALHDRVLDEFVEQVAEGGGLDDKTTEKHREADAKVADLMESLPESVLQAAGWGAEGEP